MKSSNMGRVAMVATAIISGHWSLEFLQKRQTEFLRAMVACRWTW